MPPDLKIWSCWFLSIYNYLPNSHTCTKLIHKLFLLYSTSDTVNLHFKQVYFKIVHNKTIQSIFSSNARILPCSISKNVKVPVPLQSLLHFIIQFKSTFHLCTLPNTNVKTHWISVPQTPVSHNLKIRTVISTHNVNHNNLLTMTCCLSKRRDRLLTITWITNELLFTTSY